VLFDKRGFEPVTGPGVWKWGAHEKPDLPLAFNERRTREFRRESGGPSFPQKKIEFGFGGDAVFHCLERLEFELYCTFDHQNNYYFYLDKLRGPHFQKLGATYPQTSLRGSAYEENWNTIKS